jgi:hypothetical protein
MNLVPYISTWAVLAVVVIILAVYRVSLARRDDRSLDVLVQDPGVISAQKHALQRIRTIEIWGKSLTVFELVFGVAIAFLYFYRVWQESVKMP